MSDIKAEKSKLRKKYLEMRNALSDSERSQADAVIFDRLTMLPEYIAADTVFTYVSVGSEADTRRIINHALGNNKSVAVPKCIDNRIIEFYYINSLDDLSPGAYGIPEPREGLKPAENLSGICLVPALLFDCDGYRIGYGGGYYDRYLSSFKGTKVGVAYTDFIANSVPHGRFDLAVDVLITERGIYAKK